MVPISFALTVSLLAAPGMGADVTYAEYYVSVSTGSDATGEGTMASPWASIGHALGSIAPSEINPATLHLADGRYRETVNLASYVDLKGGYEPRSWEQDPAVYESVIRQVNTAGRSVFESVVFNLPGDPGLVCTGQANVQLVNCQVKDNGLYGGMQGGGIRTFDSASLLAVDCIIRSNSRRAEPFSGTAEEGGGVWHSSTGTAEFRGCTFYGNVADLGGGIYAERGSVVCRDCTFTHNSASWGASIHAREAASVTLINCRFTDNTLFDSSVGRIYDLYTETENCTMINCTLAGTIGSTDVAHFGGLIRNSILRGGRIAVSGDITYSNIQGYQFGGTGNIDVDPRFVNPAEEDYRLRPASPCIDRATSANAPDHDLDGNPRPVDIPARGFDGPGQGYDMGCYEYFPSPTPTATQTPGPTPTPIDVDLNGDGKIDELDLFLFSREWQRSH